MKKQAASLKRQFETKIVATHVFFPFVLAVVFLLLTAFKISGSSVGAWYQLLYGTDGTDSSIVAGHPRNIRSDEWEVLTPMTVAQAMNHYTRINPNIGHGQDMSVILDVPYKDWSTVFKPHNWSFFFLPLEYAFALKWWLLGYLLMIGCYYIFLFFNPGKRLWAALLALSLFFSPFIQWWYLAGTLATLFYGLFVLLCALHLLQRQQTPKQRLILSGLLAYFLTCFGFLLYPPFQIPTVLVLAAFFGGACLNLGQKEGWKRLGAKLIYIVIPGVIAAGLVGLFILTRWPAIQAAQNTAYPGKRVLPNGGFELTRFFSGPILGQLQDDAQAQAYGYNQSEASNFILFPFLLVALVWIGLKYRRGRQLDWRVVGLAGITLLFVWRMFVPYFGLLSKVTMLSAVPHVRLLVAFGLLNILITISVIEYLQKKKIQLPSTIVWFVWLATFGSFVLAAWQIRHVTPAFIGSTSKILFACLLASAVVPLILTRKFAWGLGILLFLSFLSTYHVNPLYIGLGPLFHSDLSKTLRAIGDADNKDGWVVAEPGTFENIASANGLRSLSGVYAYPQRTIWEPLRKQPSDEDIYNRYAHVFFTVADTVDPNQSSLDPPALDAFRARTNPCSVFLRQNRIRYILTTNELLASCVTKTKDINYPNVPFKVYQIKENP